MASQADDDLTASKTEGYKAGEKKTVEEYAKLGEIHFILSHFQQFQSRAFGPDHQSRHWSISKSAVSDIHEDQNDESLNRWKASLGISNSPALPVDPSDQRRCVIKSLALEVEGRPDITIDLAAPGSVEALKTKPFTIKEGAQFRMKATFKVQHDVLSGLKYLQVVKRKGIRVGKDEEMIVGLETEVVRKTGLTENLQGSYPPNTQEKPIYEKKCKRYIIFLELLTSLTSSQSPQTKHRAG